MEPSAEQEEDEVDFEEEGEAEKDLGSAEPEIEIVETTKPSNTIAIHKVPDDADLDALQFRLKRFGDVTHFARYGKVIVARFKQVREKY